jgi:hypothetical protein
VRALFFFKQLVSVNITNSDFRHTDVNSTLTFAGKQRLTSFEVP